MTPRVQSATSCLPEGIQRSGISQAEQRVLLLILQGLNNGVIADRLTLSRRTVEGHVSSLLRKTGCHSRTQLVLWALGQG